MRKKKNHLISSKKGYYETAYCKLYGANKFEDLLAMTAFSMLSI